MFIPGDPEYGDEKKWSTQVAAVKAKYKAARKVKTDERDLEPNGSDLKYIAWSTDAKVIQQHQAIQQAIKKHIDAIIGRFSDNNPCNRCREYARYNLRNLANWLCDRCHDVIRDGWPDLFHQHCANQTRELERKGLYFYDNPNLHPFTRLWRAIRYRVVYRWKLWRL